MYKLLLIAVLASAASAQLNLTAALESNPSLSNLTTYLGLVPNLYTSLLNATNVTLLAPDNDAFSKLFNGSQGQALTADANLIEALFSYHVLQGTYYASNFTTTPQFITTDLSPSTHLTLLVPGAAVEGVKVGNETIFYSGILGQSRVTQANNNFTGGVIHVIDNFLTLPQNISATLVPLNLTAAAGALETANIAAGPLPQNLTAFIPNNEAWQNIANIVSNISIQTLRGVLGYHLVPNIVAYSTGLSNTTLPTLANETLHITTEGDNIFVNSAKVVIPNVIVQEGVVHIIDEVLNPQNTTVAPNPSQTGVDFAGATSQSAVPLTSGIPAPSSLPSGESSASAAATTSSSTESSSSATVASSSSSSGLANPLQTGALNAAMLFGGAAVFMNM